MLRYIGLMVLFIFGCFLLGAGAIGGLHLVGFLTNAWFVTWSVGLAWYCWRQVRRGYRGKS